MTERKRNPLAALFAAAALAFLAWFARHDLLAWTAPLFRTAAVQTSRLGRCTAPSEGEQLVVVFMREGEQVVMKACFFAGSRGTYSPRAKGPTS